MALIHHSRAFLTNPTTGVRYNGGTFFGSYPFLMVNWTGSYTSVTASNDLLLIARATGSGIDATMVRLQPCNGSNAIWGPAPAAGQCAYIKFYPSSTAFDFAFGVSSLNAKTCAVGHNLDGMDNWQSAANEIRGVAGYPDYHPYWTILAGFIPQPPLSSAWGGLRGSPVELWCVVTAVTPGTPPILTVELWVRVGGAGSLPYNYATWNGSNSQFDMHAAMTFFIGHFANASTANLVPAATASNLWIDEIIIGDNYECDPMAATRRPKIMNPVHPATATFVDNGNQILPIPDQQNSYAYHPSLGHIIQYWKFTDTNSVSTDSTINGRRLVVGARAWVDFPATGSGVIFSPTTQTAFTVWCENGTPTINVTYDAYACTLSVVLKQGGATPTGWVDQSYTSVNANYVAAIVTAINAATGWHATAAANQTYSRASSLMPTGGAVAVGTAIGSPYSCLRNMLPCDPGLGVDEASGATGNILAICYRRYNERQSQLIGKTIYPDGSMSAEFPIAGTSVGTDSYLWGNALTPIRHSSGQWVVAMNRYVSGNADGVWIATNPNADPSNGSWTLTQIVGMTQRDAQIGMPLEPAIVEVENGNLVMVSRGNGFSYLSRGTYSGGTWTWADPIGAASYLAFVCDGGTDGSKVMLFGAASPACLLYRDGVLHIIGMLDGGSTTFGCRSVLKHMTVTDTVAFSDLQESAISPIAERIYAQRVSYPSFRFAEGALCGVYGQAAHVEFLLDPTCTPKTSETLATAKTEFGQAGTAPTAAEIATALNTPGCAAERLISCPNSQAVLPTLEGGENSGHAVGVGDGTRATASMLHDNRDEMLASNADIQSYFAGYGFDVSGTDLGYTAGQAAQLVTEDIQVDRVWPPGR